MTRMDELAAADESGGEEGRAATRVRRGNGAGPSGSNARPPSSDENAMPPPPPMNRGNNNNNSNSAGGAGGGSKRGKGVASSAAAAALATCSSEDDDSDGDGAAAAAASAASVARRASRALDAAARDAAAVRARARRLQDAERAAEEADEKEEAAAIIAAASAAEEEEEEGEEEEERPAAARRNSGNNASIADADLDPQGRPFVVVGADGTEWTRARGQGLPGQVKRVVLRDFMCHEHFAVDLCPHVSFVSGANGSGKSALLQALQLALGVRAAATGRASAASSLVRSGASQATVRIELWNTGPDAHRPELFGDVVVIERRLSAAGTSSSSASQFWLKTKAGKVVSTTKREVDAVLEALSVDAANPVVVMTQDVARSFLGGGGGGGAGNAAAPDRGVGTAAASSKKFEVYMKATLLSRAEASHSTAAAAVAEHRRHVEAEAERLKERAEKVGGLERALQRLEAAEALRGETTRCERAVAWAAAKGAEATLAAVDRRVEVTGPGMLSVARERLSRAEEAQVEASAQLDDAGERGDQAVKELAEATAAFRAAKAEFTASERARTAAARAAAAADEAEATAQARRAAALAAALAVADEAERARMERATEAAERARAQERELREAFSARSATFEAARLAAIAAHNEAGTAQMQVQLAVEDAARCRRKADAMAAARSSRDPAAFFGGDAAVSVSKELAKMQQQQQKKGLKGPCAAGPLGTLVGLREPRWAPALQAAAGTVASTFFATTGADGSVLLSLFKKCGLLQSGRAAVVDPAIPPHEIKDKDVLRDSRGTPLKTLLSVLDFSNNGASSSLSSSMSSSSASFAATAARNYLIDACKVERVVLCETEGEAMSVARNVRGVSAAVLPCGTAFTFNGGTLTGRPFVGSGGWGALFGGAAQATQLAEDASRAERAVEDEKRVLADRQRAREAAGAAHRAAAAARRGAGARHEAAATALSRAEDEVSRCAGGGAGGGGGGAWVPSSQSPSSQQPAAGGNNSSSSNAIGALDEELRAARGNAADKRRELEDADATASAAAAALEDARTRNEELAAAVSNEQGGKGLEALDRAAEDSKRELTAAKEAVEKVEAQLEALVAGRERVAADAVARRDDAEGICSEHQGEEALAALEASGAFSCIDKKLLEQAGLLGTGGRGGTGAGATGEEEAEEAEAEQEDGDGTTTAAAAAARNKKKSSSNPAAKLAKVFERRAELAQKRRDRARNGVRDAEAAAGGGAGELRAELAAAKPAYVACAAKLRTHNTTLKALEASLLYRLNDFKKMDRQVEEAVNRRFIRYMKRKGHLGQVKVNRDSRTLDIKVVVHGSQQGQQQGQGQREQAAADSGNAAAGPNNARTKVKDLRQLSGGERSFTTVCFALALGEFTSCPFRALDEFDVFMDAVARRAAMASLFETAALAPHLQFVLLTPQDVRAVDEATRELRAKGLDLPGHYLKVLCMQAPKRG